MNDERIRYLLHGNNNPKGAYVLYFMQQSQRVNDNHALACAITLANERKLPVVVFFSLDPTYPDGNLRNFTFLLEGLDEVRAELISKGIGFIFRIGKPDANIRDYLLEAAVVVLDTGYLRIQREWRKNLYFDIAENYPHCDLIQVETDTIVPVNVATNKLEYGAYTIRNKLLKQLDCFLDQAEFTAPVQSYDLNLKTDPFPDDYLSFLDSLSVKKIDISHHYHGGYQQASQRLSNFISTKLDQYPYANDPALDLTSKMSPYLHYGQISPREIYTKVAATDATPEAKTAYLEQLFIRRELAWNFVCYNPEYDVFDKMTEPWAYRTMNEHLDDEREYLYTIQDYQDLKTHDPYFNACMRELLESGYMHNYMRMYWAKKIIEWSKSYHEAFSIIKTLNDTYLLDGRDPSSYAGIAWCFGKHDRPWQERPIFGKLRTMTEGGLKRKFAIDKYVARWQ